MQVIANLDIPGIQGQLRGKPVSLHGRVALTPQQAAVHALELTAGDARIKLSANLDQGLPLAAGQAWQTVPVHAEWDIHVPELQAWLDAVASGALASQGKLSGTLGKPVLAMHAHASTLQAGGVAVENINVDGQLPADPQAPLQLTASVGAVRQDSKPILHQAQLNLEGKQANHQLKLEWDAPAVAGVVALTGTLSEALDWRGQVQQLDLNGAQLGQWQLLRPAALRAAADHGEWQALCVRGERDGEALCRHAEGCLCVSGQWQAGGDKQVNLALHEFNWRMLQPWLPPELALEGTVAAHAQLRQAANQKLYGQITVDLPPSQVQFTTAEGAQALPLPYGRLAATLDGDGVATEARLDWRLGAQQAEERLLEARVQLPSVLRTGLQSSLQGAVAIQLHNWRPLLELTPAKAQFESLQGQLDGQFALAGTLAMPQATGELRFSEGELELSPTGQHLHGLQLRASAKELQQIQLDGSVKSGQGELRLTGQAGWRDGLKWHLALQGEDWQALNNAQGEVWISPDLRLSGQAQQIEVQGKIDVPRALLTPATAGGSAQAEISKDAVKVAQPLPKDAPAMPVAIAGTVELTLTQPAEIQAGDFFARLTGGVTAKFQPDRPLPLGDGRIEISEGHYRAYGQELALETGLISFSNSPLDNPQLHIRAVRAIFDNTPVKKVGVWLRGTAQSPDIVLFSEPVLVEENKIISYLTLGTAIDREQQEGALQVGTYILPKLFVSYGRSLFGAQDVMNLRYDLGKLGQYGKWAVEGKLGAQDDGVDLSYIWER